MHQIVNKHLCFRNEYQIVYRLFHEFSQAIRPISIVEMLSIIIIPILLCKPS